MTARERYLAYQRAYYKRRRAADPAWVERRKKEARAYKLRMKLIGALA